MTGLRTWPPVVAAAQAAYCAAEAAAAAAFEQTLAPERAKYEKEIRLARLAGERLPVHVLRAWFAAAYQRAKAAYDAIEGPARAQVAAVLADYHERTTP